MMTSDVGTSQYMAPEQMRAVVDRKYKLEAAHANKLDVWSLGITFYIFLASGKHPFG